MRNLLKLSPEWAEIWGHAPQSARACLGSFMRYLRDRNIAPDRVTQDHFRAWRATVSGWQAEIGALNTAIAKFNGLRRPNGSSLPRLAALPNRNDQRAAANRALPATIRGEIDRVRRHIEADVAAGGLDAATPGVVQRRLYAVARREAVDPSFTSFADLADPERLGDFVWSHEDDEAGVQLTANVARTRALQDVVRLLTVCGHVLQAGVIERELESHPRHSLDPAESTQEAVVRSDDLALDVQRRAGAIKAIIDFMQEQGL